MSLSRITRKALLYTPLLLWLLAVWLPSWSARLSLVLHGLPFARAIPTENLDIFRYVQTDSFANRAVVFSGGKPVGLIVQPLFSPAYYEPLPRAQGLEAGEPPLGFTWFVVVAYGWSWLLLAVQAIVLLVWLRRRARRTELAPA